MIRDMKGYLEIRCATQMFFRDTFLMPTFFGQLKNGRHWYFYLYAMHQLPLHINRNMEDPNSCKE